MTAEGNYWLERVRRPGRASLWPAMNGWPARGSRGEYQPNEMLSSRTSEPKASVHAGSRREVREALDIACCARVCAVSRVGAPAVRSLVRDDGGAGRLIRANQSSRLSCHPARAAAHSPSRSGATQMRDRLRNALHVAPDGCPARDPASATHRSASLHAASRAGRQAFLLAEVDGSVGSNRAPLTPPSSPRR